MSEESNISYTVIENVSVIPRARRNIVCFIREVCQPLKAYGEHKKDNYKGKTCGKPSHYLKTIQI